MKNVRNARSIAADWYSGQVSQLYAIASTGRWYDKEGAVREIRRIPDREARESLFAFIGLPVKYEVFGIQVTASGMGETLRKTRSYTKAIAAIEAARDNRKYKSFRLFDNRGTTDERIPRKTNGENWS